jgi:signal transduction histidine kinase
MVDNAIGYTPLGGIVKISLRRTGRNTVCSITDTGIGMSKEDLPLIFSKFYRGKEARSTDTEGLGIGLYIAREIVNRHKGKMWAESDGANKGSTFSFSLPVAV